MARAGGECRPRAGVGGGIVVVGGVASGTGHGAAGREGRIFEQLFPDLGGGREAAGAIPSATAGATGASASSSAPTGGQGEGKQGTGKAGEATHQGLQSVNTMLPPSGRQGEGSVGAGWLAHEAWLACGLQDILRLQDCAMQDVHANENASHVTSAYIAGQ